MAAAKKGLGPCPHSHSNWTEAVTRHLALRLTVDFKRKIVFGHVDLTVDIIADCKELRLDAKNLAIERVVDAKTNAPLHFTIPVNDPVFGSALAIPLPNATKGAQFVIRVTYNTTAHSGGLQWLDPEQTGGKKHPFMYSQFEAILARTSIPCQDTPAVKAPYSIAITAPAPLAAVCSGNFVGTNYEDDGQLTWRYEQKQPIPSYLIAWVSGSLVSAKVGPRSVVWAEKNLIERAKYEFELDTENYIKAGEKVTGVSYDWGAYDMVVLPAAFPYGGMENPQLTFLSASLLAGDRSLTNVVAHEIMHSWAGNYVTNARWADFWLNEGFDVYLERLVLGEVAKSEAHRHFAILGGYADLKKTVDSQIADGVPHWSKLTPDMTGLDPDEAFSKIPYEKGSLFLFFLERFLHKTNGKYKGDGKAGMREWLTLWYTEFRAKSVTVEVMQSHFLAFFSGKGGVSRADLDGGINWQHWLHDAGMPSYNPNDDKDIDRSLVVAADALAHKWLTAAGKDAHSDDLKAFSSKQTMYFLDALIHHSSSNKQNPFAADAKHDAAGNPLLAKIDALYGLTRSPNVEINVRFLSLCLANGHRAALEPAAKFLSQHGRGLYVKPLYSKLAALDKPFAQATYKANSAYYHTIIREYCEKLLR